MIRQDEDPHFTFLPEFPSVGVETTTTTTTSITTRITTTPTPTPTPTSSHISPTPTSAKCPTPSCAPSSITCPPCKVGFVCRLDVIVSPCQCPAASCVKPGFDTGIDSGSSGSGDESLNSKPSIIAPVVGGVAGFIVLALLTFFIIRQRRQRRTSNKGIMLSAEGHLEETPDPFKLQNQSKRMIQASGSGRSWCESTAGASSHKDVIRIAYIPSVSSEESIQLPELAVLGGGPQAPFMASYDNNHDNKHDSIASSLSTGTLDEAVVMAVSNKATPQLLRLHTIKNSNSDLIQRSNSLHSSNSIKRAKSQRRIADQSSRSEGADGKKLYDALEQLHNPQEPEQQYTPAVMVTGPSARSSAQSTISNKRGPNLPSMVLEPRPLHPNYYIRQHSPASPVTPVTPPTPTLPVVESQTTMQQSASSPTALASLLASTSTATPTISTSTISPSQSAPPSVMRSYPSLIQHPLQSSLPSQPGTGNGNTSSLGLDPNHLSQSTTPPTRDSTFSTLSDGRSTTTRGEGEEIMIFWDGHRGSRTSNL